MELFALFSSCLQIIEPKTTREEKKKNLKMLPPGVRLTKEPH